MYLHYMKETSCFAKGTRVLTESGYKPVERVKHGDRLLTHAGVFRDIINIQTNRYSKTMCAVLINSGSEINCAEEHPFYVRTYNKNRRFSEPYWKPASDLTKHDYCGMIINTKSLTVNQLNSPDEWFMMGYFVCNGWLTGGDTIGLNITDIIILERISNVLGLNHQLDQHIYTICNAKWYGILTELCAIIPEWVHNAPAELLKTFMDGIGVRISDSPELTLHLERLNLKLANVVSAYIDGKYAWFPIEHTESYESDGELVYNFEVVIDNSYIVENRIVHNCQKP